MALGTVLGDPDLGTNAFANLKTKLDNEKATQKEAQIDVDTPAQVVKDLKISANKFIAEIPTLEDKVIYIENQVVDGLNEVRARELYLECTTHANNDYKKQNAQLTNKLESKSLGRFRKIYHS
jgi:hypothetical protein